MTSNFRPERSGPGEVGGTGFSPLLDASVARLQARIVARSGDLPDPEGGLWGLEWAAERVTGILKGGIPTLFPGPPVLLAVRLLELLRTDLLQEWKRSREGDVEGDSGRDSELLSLLHAIEEVRESLLPEGWDEMGGPILDPWARELLGEVAHTLGSSLASTLFLTEALATGMSGPVNELQEAQLRIVHRAVLSVGTAAGDLLRLSGPFSEPISAGEEPRSLRDLLTQVGAALEPIAEEKGFRIDIRPLSDVAELEEPFTLKRVLLGLGLSLCYEMEEGEELVLEGEMRDEGLQFGVRAVRNGRANGGVPSDTLFIRRPRDQGWHFSLPALHLSTANRLLRNLGSDLVRSDSDEGPALSFQLP